MKIKKFTAKTFSEALELVKKEMSPDAIILSSEEKKGFRPHVEVTAAEDYGHDAPRQQEPAARSERQKKALLQPAEYERQSLRKERVTPVSAVRIPQSAFSAQAAAYGKAAPVDDKQDLREELAGLRTMIESLKKTGYEMSLPAEKRAVLKYLLDRSVREEFALRICDRTTEVNEVPRLISSDIRVRPQDAPAATIMFIGPTGVGKTTTIAKLAAKAVQAGKKAALVNLDTYRIGAVEQMRIYSRILGIPLATAGSVQELRSCLKKFTETREVVFIDTAGRNPRDEDHLAELGAIRDLGMPVEIHLLMSANTDDACMIEAAGSYARVPVDYIGFTKLDEAVRFGPLYNLCLTYARPVSWLTTGQRVPGDIERATPAGLADLIAGKERPLC